MKKIRKIAAVTMALVLSCLTFAGCTSSPTDPTVMTINGEAIPLSEFKYYYMGSKEYYEMYAGADIWEQNPDMATALKEGCVELIKQDRATRIVAKNRGVALSKEEMDGVTELLAQMEANFGTPEELQAQMDADYLTKDLYTHIYKTQVLQSKIAEQIIRKDYVHAKHILLSFENGTKEDQKAKAEEVLKQLENGADFDTLMVTYSEDPGLLYSPDGYTFGKGQMVQPFEEATYALAENEVSGLVESDFGYHIIKRLPMDDASIASLASGQNMMNDATYVAEMTEAVAELSVKFKPLFEEIDLAYFSENGENSGSSQEEEASQPPVLDSGAASEAAPSLPSDEASGQASATDSSTPSGSSAA